MKKIQITDIKDIDSPLYILIAGAIGAGKSTVVSKYLDEIDVIDPDIITMKLGNGAYDGGNVSKSMAMVKEEVTHRLEGNKSFIQQGTSANLKASINKMIKAKEKGFTTVLLYINTDVEQSINNVSSRKDRNQIESYKVVRTHKGSRLTYDFLADELVVQNELVKAVLDDLKISSVTAKQHIDYTIKYDNFFV